MKGLRARFAALLLLTMAVGGVPALVVGNLPARYAALRLPPAAPPSWVFPAAWSVLYVLMAWATARVWCSRAPARRTALVLYFVQLALNAAWTPVFFGARAFYGALLLLAVLLAAVVATQVFFARCDRFAPWLLAPYVLWLLFAGYLTAGVWALNP